MAVFNCPLVAGLGCPPRTTALPGITDARTTGSGQNGRNLNVRPLLLTACILLCGCQREPTKTVEAPRPIATASDESERTTDELIRRADDIIAQAQSYQAIHTDTVPRGTVVGPPLDPTPPPPDHRLRPAPGPAMSAPPGPNPGRKEKQNQTALERMKELVNRTFRPRVMELRRRLDALESKIDQALDACIGTTTGTSLGRIIDLDNPTFLSSDRFVVSGNVEIDNSTTPLCRVLANDALSEYRSIRGYADSIDEEARGAGIYPGLIRDLYREYHVKR